jgi:hypothetical protein
MTSISGATFSSTVTAFNDADRLTSEAIGRDLCLVEWPMTRYDVDQHQDCLKQDEDGRKRRGCSTSRKNRTGEKPGCGNYMSITRYCNNVILNREERPSKLTV